MVIGVLPRLLWWDACCVYRWLLHDAKGGNRREYGGFFIVVLGLRLGQGEEDGGGEGCGWLIWEVWMVSMDK